MKQPLASRPIGPHESSQQGRIVEVPSVNSPQDRPDELLKVYPRQITTGTQRGVQTVGYGRDKLDAPNNQISASGLNNATTTVDLAAAAPPTTGQVLTATSSTSAEWDSISRTKRVGSIISAATPTINTDAVDFFIITGQTVDITSFTTGLSGTPVQAQTLWIAITGTGSRAISWGSSFESSLVTLPTTTSGTSRLDIGFIWNVVTAKWRCVAVE